MINIKHLKCTHIHKVCDFLSAEFASLRQANLVHFRYYQVEKSPLYREIICA